MCIDYFSLLGSEVRLASARTRRESTVARKQGSSFVGRLGSGEGDKVKVTDPPL